MNKDEARHFVERYAAGHDYTAGEHAAFLQWLMSQPPGEVQPLVNEYTALLEQRPGSLPADPELYRRIEAGINAMQPPARTRRIGGRPWAWAAAAALLLSAGATYLYRQQTRTRPVALKQQQAPAPAISKATLQLANGATIVLDSAANGTLAQQDNVRITKLGNGQLRINMQGAPATAQAISYNTLSTPRGSQYEIILPDGSKAMLNAQSSLRFPSAFTGKERQVQMSGEVYFEIARNTQQPFRVAAGDITVTVLGTHFNVMAYTDETYIRTTLLEGAVNVTRGRSTRRLQPGQQALTGHGGGDDIDVRAADTEQEVAWKEGRFVTNDNIRGIMRQLARWYDVTVEYEGNVSDRALAGDIPKSPDVAQVLKMLEMTGVAHFSLSGNRITVRP